jgi:hypothetical protein
MIPTPSSATSPGEFELYYVFCLVEMDTICWRHTSCRFICRDFFWHRMVFGEVLLLVRKGLEAYHLFQGRGMCHGKQNCRVGFELLKSRIW